MTLDKRRNVAIRDLNAVIDRIAGLTGEQWNAATPCKDWSVRHVALHLTGTIPFLEHRLAEIVEHRTGTPQTSSGVTDVDAEATAADLVAALRERATAFTERLATLTEEDMTVALPGPVAFLTQNVDLYLTLAASEFAIHLNDLEVALGNDNAPVTREAIDAIDEIMGSHLAEFAGMTGNAPAAPLSIGLRGSGISRDLTWNGESWTNTAALDGRQVLVSGSDEAIARFIFGRITIDHPLLSVEGDAELARQFKTFVPGP